MFKLRAHPRFPYMERVQVRDESGVHALTGLDLAEGGLRVAGAADLVCGSEIKVYLALRRPQRNGSRFCVLQGRVVWKRDGHSGICFEEVDADTASQLAEFLSARIAA